MSKFNHAICDECWANRQPFREPTRLGAKYTKRETCCFCAKFTHSGIYVREHPDNTRCKGIHGDESLIGQKPKSLPSRELRERLTPPQVELFDWQYEYTRDGMHATLLHGFMMAVAIENPDFDYWDILREARERLT